MLGLGTNKIMNSVTELIDSYGYLVDAYAKLQEEHVNLLKEHEDTLDKYKNLLIQDNENMKKIMVLESEILKKKIEEESNGQLNNGTIQRDCETI